MICYLLDENVDPLYRTALLKREPDIVVWMVGGINAPAFQTPDPEILRWCEEHNFILVTHNRKSMPPHLAQHLAEDRHILGIFELNRAMSIGDTIEELILIWSVSRDNEYQDRIIHLPISYQL